MYRNKRLLELARFAPCMHCGIEDGTIVAAHSNQLRDGKGRGLKSHDYRISFLCGNHHAELDQGYAMTRFERVQMWEDAHRKTIAWLFILRMVTLKSNAGLNPNATGLNSTQDYCGRKAGSWR
jgi:hypothetical protein